MRRGNLGKPARVEIPVKAKSILGFDYLLKLSSKRKTVSVEVAECRVTVRAPMKIEEAFVSQWVLSHRQWVLKKLEQQRMVQTQIPVPEYNSGSQFILLGKKYTLEIVKGSKSAVVQGDNVITVVYGSRMSSDPDSIRKILSRWCRTRAQELLIAKTRAYAAKLGVSIESIAFRQTRTKWGHCTKSGKIQYNWLIILAPEAIVDYLVVHEVCHRVHMNHSKPFWRLVESLCPEYDLSRRWLKRYGGALRL